MRRALFTKSGTQRQAFADEFIGSFSDASVIHLHPKNATPVKINAARVLTSTFEDISDTNTWLRINNLIGENTLVFLENPSRYPKITSEKVRSLRRLTMQVSHVAVVDIVPFTLAIEYIYTPMAFLGRDILGYAHYYAFRENYHEVDEQGVTCRAHDYKILAPKVATVSDIGYSGFLNPRRQTVLAQSSDSENLEYQEVRDRLFASDLAGSKVVTRLADCVHAFQSRTDTLLEVLGGLQGSSLVLTNLSSYAQRLNTIFKSAGFTRAHATSYQMARASGFDNIVYHEAPIVKSYLLLDVEAAAHEGVNIVHIRGDSKVDSYLYDLLHSEINQINAFTEVLHEACHTRHG